VFSLRWLFVPMFFWLACDLPFSTKPSEEEDLFLVTHDYDGRVIRHKTAITISWSDITIKDFKEYRIEKAKIIAEDYYWVNLAQLPDSLATSYIDTLDDDGTFQYRVRVIDQQDQYRHELSNELIVPDVHALVVPDDYDNVEEAFYTKFLDEEDSLLFAPGEYNGNYRFMDKNIIIYSIDGPVTTILHGIVNLQSVVEINSGKLNGFTIVDGIGVSGGGVWVQGDGIIINCIIKNNRAVESPDANLQIYPYGYGGGIYGTDMAQIRNCTIFQNSSRRGGAGVLLDQYAQIINCTIKSNLINIPPPGESPYSGGGVFVSNRSIAVLMRNCTLSNNWSRRNGGGIMIEGQVQFTNCILNNNMAHSGGGGVAISHGNSSQITNCVFFDNGSVYYSDEFNTFWVEGNISIMNSIIDYTIDIITNNNRFYGRHASYCDITDSYIAPGEGNIPDDPKFVDSRNGDFHLRAQSPCRNSGNPGNEYKDSNGSRNDMGAYGGPYGDDWE